MLINWSKFSTGLLRWSGAAALALWGKTEGLGPVQPGEETASWGPNSSLSIHLRSLPRGWSQALLQWVMEGWYNSYKLTRDLLMSVLILIFSCSIFCKHTELSPTPRTHPWLWTFNCVPCADVQKVMVALRVYNNCWFGRKEDKCWGRNRRVNYEVTGKRLVNSAGFWRQEESRIVESRLTREVKCFLLRNASC